MSEFLDSLTREYPPEAREVTIDGESGTVYFRKISAGEREQLLRGIKVGAGLSWIEIDLSENERQKQMLVLFSVCREDGTRLFRKIEDVKKLPASKLEVLTRHAREVNDESSEDLGKD